MATDLEKLVVQLSADIKAYERQMARMVGTTDRRFSQVERRAQQASRRIDAALAGIGGRIAGAFAAAASIQGAVKLVDAATQIRNALSVAGLEGAALTSVYEKLFASAQKNAAPVESLVTLYSRLSLTQKELGVSSSELLDFTDKIALALRVGGTSATEASGALLQLSQALGGGVVRAEEFNSILEGAPTIAQATAAGLKEAGGSVAELRKLVVDGKVSSEAFFRAFEAGAVTLEQKVAGAESTLSQQFIRLQNVLIDTAGKMNAATGAGEKLGGTIETLARAIQEFGAIVASVSESDLGSLLGWFGDVIEKANQFRDVMGGVIGILDKMGKINQDIMNGRPLTTTLGEGNIQNRIDGAFEGTGAAAKSGRLPYQPSTRAVTPVSVADYKVPASEKTGGRKSADELQREIAQIKERTDALRAATAAQATINPLVDDYGFTIEKAKAQQELLNAAQKAGKAITPELSAQIDQLATAYATATAEAGKLAESQEKIRERAEQMMEAQKDVTRGIVDGFIEGKKAADVFADALRNVGNRFLDLAFDAAFDPKSGGIGSLLTGLFTGGASASTAPATVSTPSIASAGASLSAPRLPRVTPSSSAGGVVVNFSPAIDARGADAAGLARVEGELRRMKAEMPVVAERAIVGARKRGVRGL